MSTPALHRTIAPLGTERLMLEPLSPAHGDVLAPLLDDPRVARTLAPSGKPPAPGGEPEVLQAAAEHWARCGFGLWLLRDRATGQMIGRGGLERCVLAGRREVELSWAIIPERWRQGYASELAQACMKLAFDDLYLPAVVAHTQPHNLASRNVMTKAGMSYERDIVYAGHKHVLFRRCNGL